MAKKHSLPVDDQENENENSDENDENWKQSVGDWVADGSLKCKVRQLITYLKHV